VCVCVLAFVCVCVCFSVSVCVCVLWHLGVYVCVIGERVCVCTRGLWYLMR